MLTIGSGSSVNAAMNAPIVRWSWGIDSTRLPLHFDVVPQAPKICNELFALKKPKLWTLRQVADSEQRPRASSISVVRRSSQIWVQTLEFEPNQDLKRRSFKGFSTLAMRSSSKPAMLSPLWSMSTGDKIRARSSCAGGRISSAIFDDDRRRRK